MVASTRFEILYEPEDVCGYNLNICVEKIPKIIFTPKTLMSGIKG